MSPWTRAALSRCFRPDEEIAERIYERHRLLTKWLTGLGVDPAIASEDACRIEHVISAESFAAIKAHVQKHDAE